MTESPHPSPRTATEPVSGAEPVGVGADLEAGSTEFGPVGGERGSDEVGPADDELQPLDWSTGRVIKLGLAAWALALVVTLVVPDLHSGDRSWWPWTCVAGMALGVFGYVYLRRGRGNATGAH